MVYLLIYSDAVGTRDEIIDVLNHMNSVSDWRYDIPNSFYVVSDVSASLLSHMFREKLPSGRFLFVEITGNRQGFLPRGAWDFIANNR